MQVAFGSLRVKTTQPMYRLDMEQYLLFTDIDLPTSYRVDFGLSESGDTISMVGTEDGVLIPDNLLINSGTLHAWVWVDTGTYGGKTCYHAIIPVKVRGNITDIEPTPSQQTTIDTLLRAMNEAVDDSEAAAEAAEGFAENAEASADRAEQAAQSIDGKVARAEAAAQAAETAATNAEDAKDAANLFASNAAESAEAAHLSEVSAEGSASTATTKAAEASNSAAQAAASAASIEGDVQEAEQAAQQAEASASAASGSATVATNKAAEASGYATTASGKATEASNSATAAQNAQTGAEAAQVAAEAAQQAAEEAAQEAQTILVDKAPVITDTASGAIATFPDGADGLPLKKLVAQITPVQDLHGQDAPYPPGGGKNKYNKESLQSNSSVSIEQITNGIKVTCLTSGTYKSAVYYIDFDGHDGDTLYLKGSVVPSGSNNGVFSVRCCDENGSEIGTSAQRIEIYTTRPSHYGTILTGTKVGDYVAYNNVMLSLENVPYAPYSNICPISGWTGLEGKRTGKNMLNNTATTIASNGVTFTVNADGTVTANGTATGTAVLRIYQTFDSKENLFISGCPSGGQITVGYSMLATKENGTNIFGSVDTGNGFEVPASLVPDIAQIQVVVRNDTTVNNLLFKPMVCLASDSNTAYAPYSCESLSVSWGTMTVNEDGSGELVATYGEKVFDGSNDESWQGTQYSGWYIRENSLIKTNNYTSVMLCNRYPIGANQTVDHRVSGYFDVQSQYPGENWIYFHESSIETREKLREYLAQNPLQIVYKLATPQTYHFDNLTQLSSVYGINNIFVDTGDVQCEYRCDTKLYLEKLTAPTEYDMIANSAIASGKYFFVGNRLFLSTASIANGAQLIPGTNCVETNLAEALNALNS